MRTLRRVRITLRILGALYGGTVNGFRAHWQPKDRDLFNWLKNYCRTLHTVLERCDHSSRLVAELIECL